MIRYHGGPITPVFAAERLWMGRHAMVSFAYPAQVTIAAEVAQSFALDNGAFSAWKSGKPITDWKPYSEWVKEWLQHPGFDWCLIPDEIDGDEEANDELIRRFNLGRKSVQVPVWHLHESLERLRRLVTEWPRVAIGSSGEYADIDTCLWWSRMSEAMNVACDANGRPLRKLHGLRMLANTVCSHIPLSSADSTNIAINIGIDKRWPSGAYAPVSDWVKAIVLADRSETHATAARWTRTCGVQRNFELIG